MEGQAGIGKSTIWLAGVEAARERGLRVLSSRPAEVELGVAYAGLGDLLEEALVDVLPELPLPRGVARSRSLFCSGTGQTSRSTSERWPSPSGRAAPSRGARADPGRDRRRPVAGPSSASALAFALRRLEDENVRLLLARRLGDGIPVSELELASTSSRSSVCTLARSVRRAARDPAAAARPGVRAADTTPPARGVRREPVLRARTCTRPRRRRRSDAAAAGAGDAGGAVRARLDGLTDETRDALLLACAHGGLTPAFLASWTTRARAGVRRPRDRAARMGSSVLRTRCSPPCCTSQRPGARRLAHNAPGRDRRRSDSLARATRALAVDGAGRRDRRGARGGGQRCDRPGRSDRRRGALRARLPCRHRTRARGSPPARPSPPHMPTSPRAREHVLEPSPSSCSATLRWSSPCRGTRAHVRFRGMRARGHAPRRGGARGCGGSPGYRCRSSNGSPSADRERAGVGGESRASPALRLADDLDDDPLRAGALSGSPCPASTAGTQAASWSADVPTGSGRIR